MKRPWIAPLSEMGVHDTDNAGFSQRRLSAIRGSDERNRGHNHSKNKASRTEVVQFSSRFHHGSKSRGRGMDAVIFEKDEWERLLTWEFGPIHNVSARVLAFV
jgi:hypothetical protein